MVPPSVMQGRFAVIVLQMRVGFTTEKQSSYLHGIPLRRKMEWRVAVFVRGIVGKAVGNTPWHGIVP